MHKSHVTADVDRGTENLTHTNSDHDDTGGSYGRHLGFDMHSSYLYSKKVSLMGKGSASLVIYA